jgi:FtsH-binding integral membrane protein
MKVFKKLLGIRLSHLFILLFFVFYIVLRIRPQMIFTPGELAVFSVNSFLFGYYFAPILSAQKARVDNLIHAVRQEEMVMLDVLAQSHLLKDDIRHELKVKLRAYLDTIIDNEKVQADNLQYDELLRFTQEPRFKDNAVMHTVYDRVSKTQEDRDTLQNLYATKVFSHEWLVLFVLFGITLFFAIQTNFGGSELFHMLLAVLCAGLTLLIVIMIKFATLTHKQARRIWEPLHYLMRSHFEDVPQKEAKAEEHAINVAAAAEKA